MGLVLPVLGENPDQRYAITLGSVARVLRFTWRPRLSAWYLSIHATDGSAIAQGRRCSAGWSPLAGVRISALPDGVLFVDGVGTFDTPPRMLFYDTADLEAVAETEDRGYVLDTGDSANEGTAGGNSYEQWAAIHTGILSYYHTPTVWYAAEADGVATDPATPDAPQDVTSLVDLVAAQTPANTVLSVLSGTPQYYAAGTEPAAPMGTRFGSISTDGRAQSAANVDASASSSRFYAAGAVFRYEAFAGAARTIFRGPRTTIQVNDAGKVQVWTIDGTGTYYAEGDAPAGETIAVMVIGARPSTQRIIYLWVNGVQVTTTNVPAVSGATTDTVQIGDTAWGTEELRVGLAAFWGDLALSATARRERFARRWYELVRARMGLG